MAPSHEAKAVRFCLWWMGAWFLILLIAVAVNTKRAYGQNIPAYTVAYVCSNVWADDLLIDSARKTIQVRSCPPPDVIFRNSFE